MSLSKPSPPTGSLVPNLSSLLSSEFLDHLVRYLGTWSGTDKLFTIVQFSLKLLVPVLNLRARFQYRAGMKGTPSSDAASRLGKFASTISDSRTLWRFWGLFPIIQWLISLERNPHPTKDMLHIERIQAWSMMGFYPLEHLSYLVSHDIIPSQLSSLSLNAGTLGMWSARFWATYVILQIVHLREDRKLLQARTRNYRRAKRNSLVSGEEGEIQKSWDAYWNEVVINAVNLPLALHWSSKKGFIKSEVLLSILNLVAAIASFRSGWRATARPAPSTDDFPEPLEPVDPATTTGYDVSD
ncbi:hypothetical protein D9758_000634 [Tetrapyrgos nigripes]|uniref:Uncharacterized protein n=1 Tax=Tetrapyrgos nigripes TaxID=182062 RepID=A0A8H5GZ25_9AGAR|nr:hypothetical protein D9758_000634 [Tetrapyrgos nigripes]